MQVYEMKVFGLLKVRVWEDWTAAEALSAFHLVMPPGRPGVHCNSSCPGNEVGKVQVIELECTAGNLCWCSRQWCTVPHEMVLGFRGCASAVRPRWLSSPPRVGPRCAALWWKDSCDWVVVSFLLSRTLNNGSTSLLNTLLEIYREEWLHRQMRYLSACQQHSRLWRGQSHTTRRQLPSNSVLFSGSVCGHDVWNRLPSLHAVATSTYPYPKVDST